MWDGRGELRGSDHDLIEDNCDLRGRLCGAGEPGNGAIREDANGPRRSTGWAPRLLAATDAEHALRAQHNAPAGTRGAGRAPPGDRRASVPAAAGSFA